MSTKNNRPAWSDNKKLTVINFFGGPGCGKSTTATAVFSRMKRLNYKVEFVHEVAKDFVWEKWSQIFGEQDYIFAHQHRLLRRLISHDIDYAVTDSPILLSLFYLPEDFPDSFKPFVLDVFNSYNNINIYLKRSEQIQYFQTGRNETLEQAKEKDQMILAFFEQNKIPFWNVLAGDTAEDTIIRIIEQNKK